MASLFLVAATLAIVWLDRTRFGRSLTAAGVILLGVGPMIESSTLRTPTEFSRRLTDDESAAVSYWTNQRDAFAVNVRKRN